jgi:hypothetical protein
MVKLRHSLDEIARLGDALYEHDVLPTVTDGDARRYVAIDVDTDADQLAAADRVLARNPSAQIWFRRVGRSYVHRFVRHPLGESRP